MKIKTNLKILIILGIMLLALFIFNTSIVNATEVDEEYIQNLLDKIPNTMELDIQEVEYEKAQSMVLNNVEKILKENSIQYEKTTNEYDYSYLILKEKLSNGHNLQIGVSDLSFFSNDFFYNQYVRISEYQDNIVYGDSKTKKIQIKFNNTDKYNSADEEYVKKLKLLKPKYFETNINYITGLSEKEALETNIINDNTITIKVDSQCYGYSDLNFISMEGSMDIGIFKNGILYNSINLGNIYTIPVINVPNSIKDTDIKDYVINNIKTYNKEFAEGITEIEKGIGLNNIYYKDIEEGYTVNSTTGQGELISNVIIIRKEKNIETIDKTTNIKLDTTTDIVPSNIVLETKEIKEEKILDEVKKNLKDVSDKFITYDITLKSNGVAIQPNGKVKISIPIPENFDKTKIVVFRIENNGTKVKYDTKIEDNVAIIETDHFSTYVLAENNVKANSETNSTDIQDKQNTNKEEKDETPKTGTIDIINYVLITMTLAGIGIVVLKKNLK